MTLVAVAVQAPGGSLAPDSRAFELRTYTAAPGKLEALHARFRDHTNRLFAKHGIKIVGFWVPSDKDEGADNTLVYMLEHPDRAAREKAWEAFRQDPEWIAVRDASEAKGKLVEKVRLGDAHGHRLLTDEVASFRRETQRRPRRKLMGPTKPRHFRGANAPL